MDSHPESRRGSSSKRAGEKSNSHPMRGRGRKLQPEEAVGALKVAQDRVAQRIFELEGATPAHQTLGDLIIKDVLILASIAFWPAVFYWLV